MQFTNRYMDTFGFKWEKTPYVDGKVMLAYPGGVADIKVCVHDADFFKVAIASRGGTRTPLQPDHKRLLSGLLIVVQPIKHMSIGTHCYISPVLITRSHSRLAWNKITGQWSIWLWAIMAQSGQFYVSMTSQHQPLPYSTPYKVPQVPKCTQITIPWMMSHKVTSGLVTI